MPGRRSPWPSSSRPTMRKRSSATRCTRCWRPTWRTSRFSWSTMARRTARLMSCTGRSAMSRACAWSARTTAANGRPSIWRWKARMRTSWSRSMPIRSLRPMHYVCSCGTSAMSTVAAVAGHAVVGNRVNLITRLQALEYVTNQNLDRRALEVVNGITVVPGAIGAWRREALLAIGGFSVRHTGRGRRCHRAARAGGLEGAVRAPRHRAHGGAGEHRHVHEAALALDVRNAAGGLQEPRGDVAHASRRAGSLRPAQYHHLPILVHAGGADHRPDAGLEHFRLAQQFQHAAG